MNLDTSEFIRGFNIEKQAYVDADMAARMHDPNGVGKPLLDKIAPNGIGNAINGFKDSVTGWGVKDWMGRNPGMVGGLGVGLGALGTMALSHLFGGGNKPAPAPAAAPAPAFKAPAPRPFAFGRNPTG